MRRVLYRTSIALQSFSAFFVMKLSEKLLTSRRRRTILLGKQLAESQKARVQ